jgi:hypothetical protein
MRDLEFIDYFTIFGLLSIIVLAIIVSLIK